MSTDDSSKPAAPYKFGRIVQGVEFPNRYPDVWERQQKKTSSIPRVVAAPAGRQIELLLEMSRCLPEPFGILYVLTVRRGTRDIGRYQHPEQLSRAAMESLVGGFGDFFEKDARHALWVTSLNKLDILVYDQHDWIFSYGPLEEYEKILAQNGLRPGEVRRPEPHTHHYNAEFDREEDRLMASAAWRWTPLRKGDDDRDRPSDPPPPAP
jgi:hypothetical protein